MALQKFEIEQGLSIHNPSSNSRVEHIFGFGAPADDAPVGSLYSETSSGGQYIKVAAGFGAANWKLLATSESVSAAIGTWRPERVVLVTNEVQGPGVRDVVANPFSDDEGTPVPTSDFLIGNYIIADASGTPFLLKIENQSGDLVYLGLPDMPMVKDDTFVARHYLPDVDGQEGPAIVNYNGSVMVKLADADWGRADALALAPSYASQTGSISAADTVESAIEKLDGNLGVQAQALSDLTTAIGIPANQTTMGDLSGTVNPMGSGYDSVLADSTASDNFGILNYYLSQMIARYAQVSPNSYTTILTLPLGMQALSVKCFIQMAPGLSTSPVTAAELHVVASCAGNGDGSASDCDYSVISKLKTTTRNGVAVTDDYELLCRAKISDTEDSVEIQVTSSALLGGNPIDVYVRALIQGSNFS